MPEVTLPEPMEHTREVLASPARFKWVACGRRWAKSTSGLIMAVEGHGPVRGHFPGALQGAHIWWVTRNDAVALEVWDWLKESLRDAWIDKHEDDMRIILPTKGIIRVRSAHEPESLRGSGLDGLILDEAAFMNERAYMVLRPSIVDKKGWVAAFSTANGKNWFWEKWDKAPSRKGHCAWHKPSCENPLVTQEELEEAHGDMPDADFRREFLCDFEAEGVGSFKREWFKTWDAIPNYSLLNKYIVVDPAGKKKKRSDYTGMWVIGLAPDKSYWALDVVRDRFSLSERADQLFYLWKKWGSDGFGGMDRMQEVRYEEYGMMADIEYIQERQDRELFRFPVIGVGGVLSKEDRIATMEPSFRADRWRFLPSKHYTDHTGNAWELVSEFLETEYITFPGQPIRGHFDLFDALSRITCNQKKHPLRWPKPLKTVGDYDFKRSRKRKRRRWMAR